MREELKNINDILLKELKESNSSNVFVLWFQSLQLYDLTGDEAILTIDNAFKRDIVEKKYMGTLTDIISKTLGFPVKVRLELAKSESDSFSIPSFPEKQEVKEPSLFHEKDLPPLTPKFIESTDIVKEYTFDNFIVGDSNKFAHAASMAVATNPFDVYNPLFICGPSGLGKTHLLYAITNEIKKNKPNVHITLKKCEDFTNQLIESIRAGKTAAFRETYRSTDVLLIDDVQFLAGKESTQEEFFHTFNELYEHKKQIILTSDRPPRDIQRLEERLRNRFEWGLIADIQKPNIELRTAIIQNKIAYLGIDMPKDVVDFLAASIHSNVRQIEGAIKKIAAISRMTDSPITLPLCRRAIADLIADSVSAADMIERIFSVVASHYHVSVDDIKSTKRDAQISYARHVCIYLIRQMNELTLKQIAAHVSRDHATVIHSIKLIANEMDTSEEKRMEIEELAKEIGMQ